MTTTAWHQKVAAGLCGRCGKVPPAKGETTCKACHEYRTKTRSNMIRKRSKNGLCPDCGGPREGSLRCCTKCGENRRQALVKHRDKVKAEVFEAYGGAICSCKNCPERKNPRIEFLTLNHINGGGTKHRASLGGVRKPGAGFTCGGETTYRWLRKNGFPPGYNVLCWNCQWGVHINNGVCPHEQESKR